MSRRSLTALLLSLLLAPAAAHAASPGQPAADRGTERFRAHDYAGARDAFRDAVRRDPHLFGAWEGLGWAEYRLGDVDQALRTWRDLLRVQPGRTSTRRAIAAAERAAAAQAPGPAPARPRPTESARLVRKPARAGTDRVAREAVRLLQRGDAALRADRPRDAVQAYRSAVEIRPGDPEGLVRLGVALRRGGDVAEAVEVWSRAERVPSAPPRVHRYLAEAHLDQGDRPAARDELRHAIERTPRGDPDAQLALADVALRLGDPAVAASCLSAALPLRREAAWTSRIAALFEKRKAIDAGVSFFERAPDDLPGRGPALARLLADQGAAAVDAGRFADAAGVLERALALDGANPLAMRELGWAYRRLDRPQDAERVWRRYADAYPRLGEPHDLLARLYQERGAAQQAVAESRTSLAIDPLRHRDPAALLQLADMGLAMGNAAAADESLATLVALRPEGSWAMRMADLFVKRRTLEHGLDFFARQVPPDFPGKEKALARILTAQGDREYQGGRFPAAAVALEHALAADADDRNALRDLGVVYRRMGRDSDAERAWRAYARAHPAEAEPHDLLSRLYLDRHAYAQALEHARASLAIDPRQRDPLVRTIRSLFGLGRVQEARRLTADLAGRLPDDAEAQRLHAEALSKAGDPVDAARQWARAARLDPSIEVRQNWIRARYQAGDADGAVKDARAAVRDPAAPISLVELLAADALARDDLGDAARWFRVLTAREPGRLNDWRTLLQVLGREGKFEEAVVTAREALTHLPDRVELELDLVSALRDSGHGDEALALASRLVERYPDNGAAYRTRLALLADAGRQGEALRALSRSPPSFFTDQERRLVEATLRAGGGDATAAERLLRPMARPQGEISVPILLYHGVVGVERSPQLSAAAFQDQMAALASSGYHPITLRELSHMLDGTTPFPPRPILITFDDARSDSFTYADPILARFGFKATMFVPTGFIPPEDAFYAGWSTLARFAATGRWDLQAHGHAAHGRVPIDAAGTTGEFLVYRAWLPDRGRLETGEEFAARLDHDYRICRSTLEEHIPGAEVIGYAYPYSHHALAQPATEGTLPFVNETLTRRYFRFGLVQDESGYNTFSAGSAPPLLLRRFEVPRTWSGQQLLTHLARNEPRRVARVALSRAALAEGRPAAARGIIDRLIREEPLLGPALQGDLASIAWGDDRPREAAAHLAAAPPSLAPPGADTLPSRVAFRMRPRVGLDSTVETDSDRRTLSRLAGVATVPLQPPVDLKLRVGELHLSEPGARLDGTEVTGTGTAAVGRHLDLTGWGRYRRLEPLQSVNGGASAHLRLEQHALSLEWSYVDVDTAGALARSIRSNQVSVTYELTASGWRGDAGYTHHAFTDGNRRDDVHARLLRFFGAGVRWGLGASYDRENSLFAPPEYYAPVGLDVILGRGALELESGSRSLKLQVGAGVARDTAHGTRAAGRADLRLSQGLGDRAALSLNVGASRVTGYWSAGGALLLELRL